MNSVMNSSNRFSKKLFSAVAASLIMLSLFGCGKYSSKYKAVAFVHSNTPSSAYMDFYSFEGRMVFKMKSKEGKELNYSAKLESGCARFLLVSSETETELAYVDGSDEFSSRTVSVESGTVYIIVETDEECSNGDFRFSFE